MTPMPADNIDAAAAIRRIAGLDAWRAALMIGGVLVHGYALLPSSRLFQAIELASHSFRMGAFYALSGFLAALALAHRPASGWLRQRLRVLGIPAATSVLLLSPLVYWLHRQNPDVTARELMLPFEWHHSWFLWGLIPYSVVACWIDARDRRDGSCARIAEKVQPGTLLIATALASALLFALAPPVLLAPLSPRLVRAYANVQLIAGYLPTFLFGFVLARSPLLWDRVSARWRAALAVLALLALAEAALVAGWIAPLTDHVRFLAAAVGPPVAFVLILRSALTIRRIPRAIAALSDASYTIYLVHLPLALAINLAMLPLGLHPWGQFAFTVTACIALAWAFHIAFVRRIAVLDLLFNGRLASARPSIPAAPQPSVDEPRDHVAIRAADLHAGA